MILFFIILILLPLFLSRPIKKLFIKKEFDDVYMFEDFVCNDFFAPESYHTIHLLNKPGEIITNDYLLPDFRFIQITTNYEFYIKTKFIAIGVSNQIECCDEKQFFSYKSLPDNIPLFVMIGIGGPSSLPDALYLIPYKNLTSNKLSISLISQYAVKYNQSIDFSVY